LHAKQGKHPVFVAVINTSHFHRVSFTIQFDKKSIGLPVWTDGEGTVVFSVRDAAMHFSIDFWTVQACEWLAIFDIPARLILQRLTF
jgi:hypothetical protein